MLLVCTEVQAGTLPGPALCHCFFPFARYRPLRRPPTPLWWDRASYGPLARNPGELPRKSFVRGYFPFFISILLQSLLSLTVPVNAGVPGVNVLFKQPTMAEKWRHNPGLSSRARWTLPLFCSRVGCQGGTARPRGAQSQPGGGGGGGEMHLWMPWESCWQPEAWSWSSSSLPHRQTQLSPWLWGSWRRPTLLFSPKLLPPSRSV